MAYNKRTWANGNVVGAVDLNRMEQGIEDAGTGDWLVVTTSGTGVITMDKTWQEIYDAFPNVILNYSNEYTSGKRLILNVYQDVESGNYMVAESDNGVAFSTNSATGYPSRSPFM